MKKPLIVVMLFMGAAGATPAIMTRVDATQLHVCQLIKCRQVKRYAAKNDIMQNYIHAIYVTNKGYELAADYSSNGLLAGLELTIKRNPIDEEDKKIVIQMIKDFTGSVYKAQLIGECFDKASAQVEMDDLSSGQVGFAGGSAPNGAPWVANCWAFLKPNQLINRFYITFAFE